MVGQSAIVKALGNQVKSGRVSHAYLFCGSRGTGKTSAARIMAMAVNCEHPDEGNPCLTCSACQALMSESTLDVYEMDAASNSRVEEIREMLAKTSYPPQFVRRKVYIIDEVHMLSGAAFNALLKTLEEPPEYMVFILATTEPQKLPATILSRCQRFDFGRISEADITGRLRLALPGDSADEGALQVIAAAAEGSMRDAWSLLDMCLGRGGALTEEAVRETLGIASAAFLFDFLGALGAGDAAKALSLCDDLMRSGRDPAVFLRDLGAHVRQELSVHYTGKGIRDTTGDALERLAAQASQLGTQTLLRTLTLCMQAEADARWASSPRAVLELFALRMCENSPEPAAAWKRPAPPHPAPKSPEPGPAPKQAIPEPVASAPEKPEEVKPEEEPSVPPHQAQTPPAAPLPLETAATSSGSHKTPKDAWNAMLRKVSAQNPSLYSLLHRGRYGGYENGTFRLALPPEDDIYAALLADPERSGVIRSLLSEEMGQPVNFVAGEPPAPRRAAQAAAPDENAEALIKEFGRDKIIIRKE